MTTRTAGRVLALLAWMALAAPGLQARAIETGYAPSDGVEIFYRVLGEGPPLVIMNGGPGWSSDHMLPVGERLAASHRVVLFDQRGTGRSTLASVDSASVTMGAMVEDVEALRRHLGVERWKVLGHSFGGMLAMAYAAAHPEAVERMVLSAPGGPTLEFLEWYETSLEDRLLPQEREAVARWSAPERMESDPEEAAYQVAWHTAGAFLYDRSRLDEARAGLDGSTWSVETGQAVWADLSRIGFDVRDEMRTFSRPVLVIQGRQDALGDLHAYRVAELFSDVRLEILERSAHIPWLDREERYYELVEGFLSAPARSAQSAQLVREAWTAVDTSYYDPEFHGVDWQAVGDTFTSREYPHREAAYDAIRAMLGRLENPATRFLTPEQAAAVVTEFSGQPHRGVGLLEVLSVDTDEETGEIVVVTPIPGGPAARAGLRPEDVVVAVEGADARELGLAGVVSRLRGAPGTSVGVTVRRRGDTFQVELAREEIPAVDPVEGFVREEEGYRIGYLGLRQFTGDAPARLQELVTRLREERGAEAWILDLRSNPGGLVPAVQQIGALFLGQAPLARIRNRAPEPVELAAQGERLVDGPVVVLVNEGSASAAEVLASALQLHGRAVVVGARTFGKGLAHGLVQLSDGSAVMPTMGRLETLGGRDILIEGVAPDVEVATTSWPILDPAMEPGRGGDDAYRRGVELLVEELTR